MSHQYELYEQVKAMLASKYFNDSPDARELESGDILVSSDIQIATNDDNRLLKVTLQFRCKNSGIVSRTILKMNAPSHAYKRVVDLITQINGSKTFSCFEFDYRDGEIAVRNFLQCIDYVPSPATLYTMIGDTTSKFMEYGDQLIEAIGVDANTLETHDASGALDVLDEALKGDAKSQSLLIDLIKRDPDSSYHRRLKEAANSGNGLAQTLLRKCTSEGTTRSKKSSTEYGYHGNGTPKDSMWPVLMSKNELVTKTAAAYAKYLNSGVEILNKQDLINSSYNLAAALNGNSDDCYFIAENFGSDKWPENADPQLAFQWSAYRQSQLSVFDDNYATSNAMAVFDEAHYLVLFGTEAQKISAIQAMDACAEMFCVSHGSWYWFIVHKYISLLAGVHPERVFRKPQYDYSSVVNKERAIELYKRLIDLMIAAGDSNTEDYATELEGLLGIKYYESRKGRKASGASSTNTKSGGCYIATCVYGSYDCPQVWTLRRYRDNVLAESALGRAFIRFYYAVSPRLVKVFGGCSPVRSIWKVFLDKMVVDLNEKGYQDTPYED